MCRLLLILRVAGENVHIPEFGLYEEEEARKTMLSWKPELKPDYRLLPACKLLKGTSNFALHTFWSTVKRKKLLH